MFLYHNKSPSSTSLTLAIDFSFVERFQSIHYSKVSLYDRVKSSSSVYKYRLYYICTDTSPFDSLSDSDDESPNGFNRPKVVLNQETKGEPDITAELPPVQRRMKFRKSRSPVSPQMNGDLPSPNLSSPPNQRFSPASSPRSSPISSPRGVRRFIHNRKVS